MLHGEWGGYGPKTGLTHLSLQWWVPAQSGGIRLVSRSEEDISHAGIARFRRWAHGHGIRLNLCLYNGEYGWDWSLARSACGRFQDQVVSELAEAVETYNLDGVELDLESMIRESASDKTRYVSFVASLGNALHRCAKELRIATFHSTAYTPNPEWWKELFPHVDGVVSMGYEALGVTAEDGNCTYAAQQSRAPDPSRLILGLPGWRSSWQKERLLAQLEWICRNSVAGIGIWDIQLESPAWQDERVWKCISEIRSV
jgi:hypothetical protein